MRSLVLFQSFFAVENFTAAVLVTIEEHLKEEIWMV